ncbi:MAG TPA: acyl-CoA dehydrogenase family protein, partial [Solirubrobacteraceae bacterium]|nr:acyl-CoA dehydrogenase family protein [Solirubrobacteraceae bacterium]
DGSTAWCSMVASTSSLLGAFLPEADAQLVFDDGRGIAGGVFAPRGRARRSEDGFTVTGRWSFMSGVGHCSWVMGGCLVEGPDGPETLAGGAPDVRLMLMPAEHVEVIDTWSVAGLRGTGSHDVEVSAEHVPLERGVSLFSDRPRHDGSLYAFPLFGLLAVGIAAVALGVARGALDELLAVAVAKTPSGAARPLAARATVQASLAQAEASLRGARALLLAESAAAEAEARHGKISTGARVGLRLAATHATSVAAEVTTQMYRAGGGSAIYESSPLQRRFRDANVATQHMMVAPATWELTGRLLFGLETDTAQL